MSAELTRSDVLRPLIWPNAGLLLLLATAFSSGAPEWMVRTIFGMLIVFMALYAVSYCFFALTDADALRSEKYKLQKMAIEHGLLGDSITGLQKIEDMSETKVIEAVPIEGSRK